MKKLTQKQKDCTVIFFFIFTLILELLTIFINRSVHGIVSLGSAHIFATNITGCVQAFISLNCIFMVCIQHRKGKIFSLVILISSMILIIISILSSKNLSALPGFVSTAMSLITVLLISVQFSKYSQVNQYHLSLLADATASFEFNITKDIVKNDFGFKNIDGTSFSVMNMLDIVAPCKFSDLVEKWRTVMIPEESKWKTDYYENMKDYLIQCYEKGIKDISNEYWVILKTGQRYYINIKFLLVENEHKEICGICVIRDDTGKKEQENVKYQRELEIYAYQDPVTKGQNYNIFKVAMRSKNIAGSIICLDILSFKVINTICGINKGDEIIKSIWDVVLSGIEVDKNEFAAHINADQFIFFLPTFDHKVIEHKLQCITYALAYLSEDMDIPLLQPYYGISTWVPGKKIELAHSEALAAKENVKKSQNGFFAYFDDSIGNKLINQKLIVDEYQSALENNNFVIWYQPKYNPLNNELIGAEALVRWQRFDGSFMPPSEFIPLFEKNNMIRSLDEYVFRNVCRQVKEWMNKNWKIVPISVNVSRSSLYFKNIVLKYKRIVDEYGISTKDVPIEITESAAVNNYEIKEIADELYNAGFSLHMDDFGSGYSSLASLNTMHFETLKLDKSLIDYIGKIAGDCLISHTITLAKELGIHIVAEGVETEDQVNFLKKNGCDSIQGYYFSKPIPQTEFEKLLM